MQWSLVITFHCSTCVLSLFVLSQLCAKGSKEFTEVQCAVTNECVYVVQCFLVTANDMVKMLRKKKNGPGL